MRWVRPSPLACTTVCSLALLAWGGASTPASSSEAPRSCWRYDVLVLLACAGAYLLGSAGGASGRPYARAAEAPGLERALERCDELVRRGVQPDRAALNAALDACCQLGRVAQAQHLFEQMPRLGVAPNANTYGIMIRTYASGNMAAEAAALFQSMREAGVEPSRHAYHDAILCCVKLQRLEDAIAVYNEMVRARVLPRDVTCQCLSQACQKRGWSLISDQITKDTACIAKTEILLDVFSEISTELRGTEAHAESE